MAEYRIRKINELTDVEDYSGHALEFMRANATADGVEYAVPATGGGDTILDNWDTIYDATITSPFIVAGSKVETTFVSEVTGGSTTATLTDASTFAALQDMAIPGAGVASAELIVNLLTVDTGTGIITWTTPTSTTVSSGITVYHDDTRAFNAALQNMTKHTLYAYGDFIVSAELLMDRTFRALFGGRLSVFADWPEQVTGGGCRIYARHLTGNVINMTANQTFLQGVSIAHEHGLPTAGADLHVSGSFTNVTHYRSRRGYRGIYITGTGTTKWFNYFQISNPVKYGIHVDQVFPAGGDELYNFLITDVSGGSGTADAAIYISASDIQFWGHGYVAEFRTQFHADASTGRVNLGHFHDIDFDATYGGPAIKLEKSGAYTYGGGRWSDIHGLNWFGSTPQPFMTIGANVERTRVNGLSVNRFNESGGIEEGGTNSQLSNIQIGGGDAVTTKDGIVLKSTSTGCTIGGASSVFNSRYGLTIENGATDYNIVGLKCTNNNTGASNLYSGVRANGIIANCAGIPDYETSVASAPDFIDQRANTGGVAYVATGTASAADWKQVTP